jgi:hypothetical protein
LASHFEKPFSQAILTRRAGFRRVGMNPPSHLRDKALNACAHSGRRECEYIL